MALTSSQVQTIKATVPVLQEHGNTITTVFYANLLRENPELNNVFNNANQRNNHQAQALAGSLYAYATYIDDSGVLSPAVEKICQKHASLYIRPEHYDIVGKYLLSAMGEVLGAALTQEILDAWAAAYWQLAKIMIGREGQLYKESEGWTDWRVFKIVDKVKESEVITSFYLTPVDSRPLPAFKPGQYISVETDVPGFGYLQSRQYSLSDAPRSDHYRISVKKEAGAKVGTPNAPVHPGWISNLLHDTKNVGDLLKVSHPAGDFFFDPQQDSDAPVVLLSAGVGITPMIGILNTLVQRKTPQPVSFVHGSRTTKLQAFGDHIRELAAKHQSVHAKFFIRDPNPEMDTQGVHYHAAGRLTIEALDKKQDLFLDKDRTKYFACGPDAFMADVERNLKALGVDSGRIRMEKFGTGDIVKEICR
ncbi:globin-like protein [Teratosphaeria nubilosa]|uniref:nitric oxide dioxygenase n=1 Tax=Teratosphaeria nubilosa TaxID=161662 RepID=A0A6G1KYC1_9PEZI|nr:globin-like protein [Teratosphaeria nubilosa]